ncbi:anti-sigma-I factor RsgI6-like [Liolophura sinensis]|uniref:anti-sigma-I factor RsgI6-like n=1 Tax=Liolophura sinensis TaxID=3198878 RepID=UPI003158CDA1
MAIGCVVLITGILVTTTLSQELLKNHDLEGTANWDCYSIQCQATSDHRSGTQAVKATGRHNFYEGPSQNVWVKEHHTYTFEGWAKLLTDNGKGQSLELEVEYSLKNGQKSYVNVAHHYNMRVNSGWVHLIGSFITPGSLDHIRVYFQGPEPGVEFIADGASLTDQSSGHQSSGNWKAQTSERIDRLRKSNIHFKVTTDHGVNPNSVTIETVMYKHAFPFGTAVVASIMNNNNGGSDQKYRQFIYDHFNWAVVENALKWRQLEYSEGHPTYDTAVNAIKTMRNHGIKVRGHNLIWAVEQFVPGWLKSKSPSDVRRIVDHHLHEIVGRLKGLVEHWDVNNEMLHGNWYATKLNDPDYTKGVFQTVHSIDPNVKLFLNDYNVVANGQSTDNYLAQAKDYKSSGTHVGGIGVQCHFGENQYPDFYSINSRLDKLAHAGLPIWVTELDVQSNDVNKRADFYDAALRTFFSHSAVGGIMFWGFWSEHHWRGESAALVSGPEFKMNAAGQKFLDLIHTEWKTYNSHILSKGSAFTVRGFRGDYVVRVKVNGDTPSTHSTSHSAKVTTMLIFMLMLKVDIKAFRDNKLTTEH